MIALVHPVLTARRRFSRWQLARSRAKVVQLHAEIELVQAARKLITEMGDAGDREGIELILEMIGQ